MCFEFRLACFECRLACLEFRPACLEFRPTCSARALPTSALLGLFMHCSGGLGVAQVVWACFEFCLASFEFCLACFARALPASAILGSFGHSLVRLGTAQVVWALLRWFGCCSGGLGATQVVWLLLKWFGHCLISLDLLDCTSSAFSNFLILFSFWFLQWYLAAFIRCYKGVCIFLQPFDFVTALVCFLVLYQAP